MIRVGVINFINALPLFHALTKRIIPNSFDFHIAAPKEINALLKEGKLDVALISSSSFLQNRFSYILLADIGIAATNELSSVRLFYNGDEPFLNHQTILVPSQAKTSTHLLSILYKYFWNTSPSFQDYEGSGKDLFRQEHPFLLVGDTCLEHLNGTLSSIDLSRAWHELTGKSFVFSVMATRNEVFKQNPQGIIEFHRILEDSYLWSVENRPLIIQEAQQRVRCPKETLEEYFSMLEYKLLPKHFHGLDYFSSFSL